MALVDLIPSPIYKSLRAIVFPSGQFLREVSPMNGTVLDIGGGAGIHAESILTACPEVERYDLVDLSERKIEMAAERLKPFGERANCRVADATTLGVDDTYDHVMMCDLLHHIPPANRRPLLEALPKLVRPGGRLIIKDVSNHPWPGFLMNVIHDAIATGMLINVENIQFYADQCSELGFENISVTELDSAIPYNHRLIIAEKKSS